MGFTTMGVVTTILIPVVMRVPLLRDRDEAAKKSETQHENMCSWFLTRALDCIGPYALVLRRNKEGGMRGPEKKSQAAQ